jgi:hypothetical protein
MGMAATVRVVYEDGVFKPTAPVSLPEHTEFEVPLPTGRRFQRDPDDPTGWKAIDRLIGSGKAVAPDVAANHDKYLYDDPAE